VTGDGLKARRHAREIVVDMRWRGMTVPPLYARMSSDFRDLVGSGEYAAWVAANQMPALLGRKPHRAGLRGRVRPGQSGAVRGDSWSIRPNELGTTAHRQQSMVPGRVGPSTLSRTAAGREN
jgi:hypothetical protein